MECDEMGHDVCTARAPRFGAKAKLSYAPIRRPKDGQRTVYAYHSTLAPHLPMVPIWWSRTGRHVLREARLPPACPSRVSNACFAGWELHTAACLACWQSR